VERGGGVAISTGGVARVLHHSYGPQRVVTVEQLGEYLHVGMSIPTAQTHGMVKHHSHGRGGWGIETARTQKNYRHFLHTALKI